MRQSNQYEYNNNSNYNSYGNIIAINRIMLRGKKKLFYNTIKKFLSISLSKFYICHGPLWIIT